MPGAIQILYGRGTLPVVLPDGCRATVIEKPPMPHLRNPSEVLERALESPSSGDSLSALARKAKSACILICDITRPVPNGLILPPVIRTLLNGGIPASRICVLVATGLHRPNLGAELRELVGSDWVLKTVRVENHDAYDLAAHRDLGQTASGTPVKLDRRLVEADLKIVTGLVEPHFMAGYSGGRKVIAPGVAHASTIGTFHSTRFMEDPDVCNCNFDGNTLHAEQVEIVRGLGPVYAVNICLDAERRPAFLNFGEVFASHAEAVDFMRPFAEISVAEPYRCVVASGAGYPLDKTYYQTVKGIVGALGIMEAGGSLLIASECSEGFGSKDFRDAQSLLVRQGIKGFLAETRQRSIAKVDEWQTVKLIEAIRNHRVHLFAAGLNDADKSLTGVVCHSTWREAIEAVVEESGATEVAVIPEGPYVIPFVERQLVPAA
jgi:nickel-dependent lactate racemase